MDSALQARLQNEMAARFGIAPSAARFVFAPYRICPLGAHIDHQLGRVTAMALDRGVAMAYAPVEGRHARLASLDFAGEVAVDFDRVPAAVPGDWGNYFRGAIRALERTHRLATGLVGLTAGSIAEGGLSSSAAVGVAYLLALEDINGLAIGVAQNIRLDQSIENDYLGLRNGVLDQSAILLGRRDHLTVIDCATLEHEQIAPPAAMPPFAVLIAFSGLRKALVGTDYNRRVAECAEAAQTLLEATGRRGIAPLLGNVTPEEYAAYGQRLEGAAARRAKHFFGELDRVHRGAVAWRSGDLTEFGRLVTESGRSSIENYECGAPPLMDLYRLLVETDGVCGARFSGAGFRGCCVALVDPAQAEAAAASVHAAYAAAHPDLAEAASVMLCASGDGARVVCDVRV